MLCDNKNCSRSNSGFYQVKVDDDTIGQIKTREPVNLEVKHEAPIFQFDRMDHFIASNLKFFISEAVGFRKGLKEGSIILSEPILEQFLKTLITNCKYIEFIISDSSEEAGCCGYSTSGPKDLKIYINKREFKNNYEDVFNRLLIDYSFDLEHVI